MRPRSRIILAVLELYLQKLILFFIRTIKPMKKLNDLLQLLKFCFCIQVKSVNVVLLQLC